MDPLGKNRRVSRAVIELSDAVVSFGRVRVLDGVSLALAPGDVVAIRGRNGSGKTTLLRAMAGVLALSAGRRTGPATCAYVPALIEPPVLSAGSWLRSVPRVRRDDGAAILEILGFTGDLSRSCRVLSFGNLRKLMIAEAFASNSRLVVVDEASAGLDAAGIAGLTALVASRRAQAGALVLADQHERPTLGADIITTVRAGKLASSIGEHGDVPSGDVEITLVGPAARRDHLVERAARIGFSPTEGGA